MTSRWWSIFKFFTLLVLLQITILGAGHGVIFFFMLYFHDGFKLWNPVLSFGTFILAICFFLTALVFQHKKTECLAGLTVVLAWIVFYFELFNSQESFLGTLLFSIVLSFPFHGFALKVYAWPLLGDLHSKGK